VTGSSSRAEPASPSSRAEPASPSSRAEPAGLLVLVATPIGNLADLSPRAAQALAGADVVVCEDTRRTRGLLSHAGIRGARLVALHEHNEQVRSAEVVEELRAGRTVALVSDAGTPAVSDPGSRLVLAAAEAGVRVTIVPGPSAVPAAVAVSGFEGSRFCFEGFLPRRGPERARRLRVIAADDRPTVVLEAPHRLARTLEDLAEACGPERRVVVVRELTKLHEEVVRTTLGDAAERARAGAPKGEHTLVVEGAGPRPSPAGASLEAAVAAALERGLSSRDAAAFAASALRVPRRDAYAAAVRLRGPERAGAGGRPPPADPGAPERSRQNAR
jgi:16S rRNA (cytidine1402-2'-O)-methyltransferase